MYESKYISRLYFSNYLKANINLNRFFWVNSKYKMSQYHAHEEEGGWGSLEEAAQKIIRTCNTNSDLKVSWGNQIA